MVYCDYFSMTKNYTIFLYLYKNGKLLFIYEKNEMFAMSIVNIIEIKYITHLNIVSYGWIKYIAIAVAIAKNPAASSKNAPEKERNKKEKCKN